MTNEDSKINNNSSKKNLKEDKFRVYSISDDGNYKEVRSPQYFINSIIPKDMAEYLFLLRLGLSLERRRPEPKENLLSRPSGCGRSRLGSRVRVLHSVRAPCVWGTGGPSLTNGWLASRGRRRKLSDTTPSDSTLHRSCAGTEEKKHIAQPHRGSSGRNGQADH